MSNKLFGSGGGIGQGAINPRYNGVQINRSSYGDCVPLIYGTTRVAGILLWYGDFLATPHNQKSGGKGFGSGGSGTTSYIYSASIIMALGEGVMRTVNTIYNNQQTNTPGTLNLYFKQGAPDQAVWTGLANHPDQALAYDGTAYLASSSFDLGSTAAVPDMTFEVSALIPFQGTVGNDAACAEILPDYLNDPAHGAGFQYLETASISPLAPNNYYQYCGALGYFLSPQELTQRTAKDFVNEILEITNSAPVMSGARLRIVPFADTPVAANGFRYTPNMAPEYDFGDSDYLDKHDGMPVTLTRKAPMNRYNKVRVEFLNRANLYNTDIAEASDATDIDLNGERLQSTLTFHAITTSSVARHVAQLRLQRELYIVNTYEWKTRADFGLLEPMDLVTLTDSVLGLQRQLVRITKIEDDDLDELTFTAEEVPIGVASAPLYAWSDAAGFAANYGVSPGPVSPPVIFSAPPLLIGPYGGYETWLAVAAVNPLWGGCTVHASLDGITYKTVGTVSMPARMGVLHTALPPQVDPDTVNTLLVDMLTPRMQLNPALQSDADNLRSLLYVDGEIMAYRDAALTATPAQYALHYLRRGVYGSFDATHAVGSSFVRLDEALLRLPFDKGMIGQTLHFKFTSYNIYGAGEEALANVVDYPYVLAAAAVGMGANAIYAMVTSPAITLAADVNGVVGSFLTAHGNMRVYDGNLEVTAQCAFSIPTGGAVNCAGTIGGGLGSVGWTFDERAVTFDNVNASFGAGAVSNFDAAGYYTVTALTADSGTLTVRANFLGVDYDVNVSLAKARAGNAGGKGDPGVIGLTGLSMMLSLSNCNLFAYAGGIVPDYSAAQGHITVLQGTNNVTTSCTFTALGDPNTVGSVDAGGNYQVTFMTLSALSGMLTLQAVYLGTILTATFMVTKIVVGYELVTADPTTFLSEGRFVFNTVTGHLRKFHNGVWQDVVNANDLTGTLTDAQIAGIAAAKIIGTLTDAQLIGLAASKLTGTLTDAQIAGIAAAKLIGTIGATQITPKSITAGQIFAGTITGDLVAANTIVGTSIQSGTLTSLQIQAGSIAAGDIQAKSLTAAQIAGSTITGDLIAGNTIVGTNIQAGAVSAREIASRSILADNIGVGVITAAEIMSNTITALQLSTAQLITNSAQIGTGTIQTANIADAQITTAKIGTGQITTAKIGAGQITTALIGSEQVGTSQIGQLAVGSLQIAGNAVTIPVSALQGAATTVPGSFVAVRAANIIDPAPAGAVWTTVVCSPSVATDGSFPFLVQALYNVYRMVSGVAANLVFIYRSTSPLAVGAVATGVRGGFVFLNAGLLAQYPPVMTQWLDSPPAGIYYYALAVASGEEGPNAKVALATVVSGCMINVLGIKK